MFHGQILWIYFDRFRKFKLKPKIFANANDEEMYQTAMKEMWRSQVTDKDSSIYGALGIKHLKQAYSYNNLYGLLASKY